VSADYNLAAISQGISDSCGVAQESILLQSASRSPNQPLDQKMQIYAVNYMRATTQEPNSLCHQVYPSTVRFKSGRVSTSVSRRL
jgi:hypothetical protein